MNSIKSSISQMKREPRRAGDLAKFLQVVRDELASGPGSVIQRSGHSLYHYHFTLLLLPNPKGFILIL